MVPPEPCSRLRIQERRVKAQVLLRFDGVLDGTTYRAVRDRIVKCAMDEPAAIVLDVSALRVPRESAWSVFTSARWLVGQWPDVPLVLVCSHAAGRRIITANGIVRYVSLHDTLTAAMAAMAARATPVRKRARQHWPATTSNVAAARSFVSHWLGEWSQGDLTATACVVTTALVDNVMRHTTSDLDLRLEYDGETVTVAVTDDCVTPASVREHDDMGVRLSELQIVSALTRVWGNSPLADGKVVWAVMGPENRL